MTAQELSDATRREARAAGLRLQNVLVEPDAGNPGQWLVHVLGHESSGGHSAFWFRVDARDGRAAVRSRIARMVGALAPWP